MSQSLTRRLATCCLDSSSKEIRRSLVTIQRQIPERLTTPTRTQLPSQYWTQLPPRLRPDRVRRKITVYPPPPSEAKRCKEPIKLIDEQQLAKLDPTGARSRLFDMMNRDRPQPGDILHVTFKTGEPFSGVIMWIKGSGPHKSVMLRNQLTGVGMEMSVKVHSPDVQSMEIVERAKKRARRNKLTYLRKPEHDRGSVQRIVEQYLRQRAQLAGKKATTSATLGKKKKGRR